MVDAEDIDGRPVKAVTCIADGAQTDGKPSSRYLTLLRESARAHGLPEHWIDKLHNIRSSD